MARRVCSVKPAAHGPAGLKLRQSFLVHSKVGFLRRYTTAMWQQMRVRLLGQTAARCLGVATPDSAPAGERACSGLAASTRASANYCARPAAPTQLITTGRLSCMHAVGLGPQRRPGIAAQAAIHAATHSVTGAAVVPWTQCHPAAAGAPASRTSMLVDGINASGESAIQPRFPPHRAHSAQAGFVRGPDLMILREMLHTGHLCA